MTPKRDDPYVGVLAISLLATMLGLVLLVIGMLTSPAIEPTPRLPERPTRVG